MGALDCISVEWAQARLCLFSVTQALVGEWLADRHAVIGRMGACAPMDQISGY